MSDLTIIQMERQKKTIVQAVQEYSKRLFGFIRGRVKTDEDAEDILQDVWYQLSSVVDLESIEQLSAWLFKVARNRITDKQRKQKTTPLEDLAYEDEDGELNFSEVILADNITPETELEREFFWQQLLSALNELPDEQRDVFIWRT